MTEESDTSSLASGPTHSPAKRSLRLIAALIDGIISLAVALPLILYFDVWSKASSGTPLERHVIATMAIWGIVSFTAMNFRLLDRYGQTIGKWCVDISILGADGQRKSALRLLARRYLPLWIAPYAPLLGGVLPLLDVLFIYGPSRRCIHDYIADTIVVDGAR